MQSILMSVVALAAGFSDPSDKSAEAVPAAETKRVRWATLPAVKQNSYRVRRMAGNPKIDADWNKAAWKDVPPLTIEYYMGSAPEHQPKAQARVAYDDDAVYVIWKVEDNHVLGKRTKHQQDVWRDSCVEFFFTPGGDPADRGYFNLETNCHGVKLFGAHVAGAKEDAFTDEDFASMTTASSLKGPIDPEIAKPTTWTLEYKIPFRVIERLTKIERPRPGVTWRANFYKCADGSSHPHWLTWSPISNADPQFHLPKFFGVLTFE